MVKRVVTVAVAMAFASGWAKTNTWVSGSSDWSNPDSFVEKVPLEPGDVVFIPQDVTAVADDSKEASWNAFAGVSYVCFRGNRSRLEVTVGETDGVPNERDVSCEVHYSSVTANTRKNYGKFIKKGPGKLRFTNLSTSSVLATPIEIVAGTLALPDQYDEAHKVNPIIGPVTIHEDGVLVTSRLATGSSISYGVTSTSAIEGSGMIKNTAGQRLNVNGDSWCEFSGRISGVRWNSSGYIRLTGVNNAFTLSLTITGGETAFAKIGNLADSVTSLGLNQNFVHNGPSTFTYIGNGPDETDRSITLFGVDGAPAAFDGGQHGALTFNGDLVNSTRDAGFRTPKTYYFQGSNVVDCVFAGVVTDTYYNEQYLPLTLGKRGSGTWLFADNAKRTWGGELDIEDGVLKCSSLAEAGTVCSLGTAAALPNGFAWKFGTDTTRGTLAYVGDDDVVLSTRSAVAVGKGGVLANSGAGRMVYYAGVSKRDQASTFGVGGTSAADNIIGNVNGLSFVKEGPGKWILDSTCDLSGELDVRGGTLYVCDRTKYNWIRWVVKQSQKAVREAKDDANIRVVEMGLWDADGNRVNGGLSYVTNYCKQAAASLMPGQCAFDAEGTLHDAVSNTTYPCAALFDDGTSIRQGWSTIAQIARKINGTTVFPMKDDPDTWLPVIMRLPIGANRVASFDFVNNANASSLKCRDVGCFALEGSVDGVHWTDIGGGDQTVTGNGKWAFSKGTYSAGTAATHTDGLPVVGGPTGVSPSLDKVRSVSVASGARLVGETKAVVINGLRVDAEGAGTIENCTIAADGTLEVANLPRGQEAVLPIGLNGCDGVRQIANWTLKKDGVVLPRQISVDADGHIRIAAPGMMLMIK